MTTNNAKRIKAYWNRKGMIIILVGLTAIAIFLFDQYMLCSRAVQKGYQRLETYSPKEIELGYGTMTYVD